MKKILIVEDELIIASEIRRTLQRLGYEVIDVVSNGESALAVARDAKPDLILMDVNIDGPIDGIETARRVREQFQTPVVFLTALSDGPTIERAKQVEPYGFIVKPFDDHDLRTTVEIALYRHERDQALRQREAQLSQAFGGLDELVIVTTARFEVELMNRAVSKLSGVTFTGQPLRLNDVVLFYTQNRVRVDWGDFLTQQQDLPDERLICFFPVTGRELGLSVRINHISLDEVTTTGWTFVLRESQSEPESAERPSLPADATETVAKKFLFAKKGAKYQRVPLSDILWLEALENYVIIHTDKDKFVVYATLKSIESKLPAEDFFKTHRSFLVNIDKVEGYEDGYVYIHGKPLPVSRSAKDELKDRLFLL